MIRNAVQHSENVRNSLVLNYESAALPTELCRAFTMENYGCERLTIHSGRGPPERLACSSCSNVASKAALLASGGTMTRIIT
jgi:hypothetical protein